MSGIIRKFHYDDSQDLTTIHSSQDIEAIIESNKQQYNTGTKVGSEFRKIASVPLIVVEQMIQQHILNERLQVVDHKAFDRWMNDPDNRFFRTSPERV